MIRQKELTQDLIAHYQELADETNKPASNLRQRSRVLCSVDLFRVVVCQKEKEFVKSLAYGHWISDKEWITEAWYLSQAYEILIRIDEINVALFGGFLTSGNTLTVCENGGLIAIDTAGPSAVANINIPATNPNLPSIVEIEGLKAGCDVPFYTSTGAGSSGGSNIGSIAIGGVGGIRNGDSIEMCDGARQQIARIDESFNICNTNNQIAVNPVVIAAGVGVGLWILDKLAERVFAPELDATAAWIREPLEVFGTEVEAFTAELDALTAADIAKDSEDAARKAEEDLNDANEDLNRVMNDPTSTDKEKENAQDRVQEMQQEADEARMKADEEKAWAEKTKEEAEKARNKAEERKKKAESSTTATNPGAEGTTATCDARKQQWENFKSQCDQTQSWTRPGTACNGFVRASCGCVDIREINPLPDDTLMSCRIVSVDEAELRKQYCKLMPYRSLIEDRIVPDCDSSQTQPSEIPFDPSSICNNPAVVLQEDQCLDHVVTFPFTTPVTIGDPPFPVPNIVQLGTKLIVGSWSVPE